MDMNIVNIKESDPYAEICKYLNFEYDENKKGD